MDFNKINAVAQLKDLPLVKLEDLEAGAFYIITAARKVNTKYGVGVIIHLSDSHSVFVNTRLAKFFAENIKMFENFQKYIGKGTITLEYLGGKYHNIRLHPDPMLLLASPADEVNFDVINAVAEFKELPLIKISQLQRNYVYTITAAFKVETKYGVGVILHLSNAHSVFVNNRLAKFFEDNPKQFENFCNHIEKGSPTLQYSGGESNAVFMQPDPNVKVENKADQAHFDKINAELRELPLLKLSQLALNTRYTITAALKVNTKYGMSVIVHLNNAHSVFLNRRTSKFFIENPKQFDGLLDEIKRGSAKLEYLGGEYNEIKFHAEDEGSTA
ncbi:uncharacterized protein LOC107041879 [Diachasma alloeum]|uniref:uncharacterized protein LOC107041879 n=1 Tax=Diachasma alloeum TaxID=454923 RepID=UPI00073841DA|nr:uncharacterized protein LOC107041879 [Diachasma alloeum]